MEPQALAQSVRKADRGAVAEALNLFDDQREIARAAAIEFFDALPSGRLSREGHLIGVTGPPGVGKSSLAGSLIGAWRRAGRTVGVLAVDPSSRRTGGALLGDRIRMLRPESDDGVFIRSLASRGRLGGMASEAWPMSQVLLTAFDMVLVETVGVGQSEVDVADLTDTIVYVVQPASGDTIQFLKAGVMEIPHLLVVNKADIGIPAQRVARELADVAAFSEPEDGWTRPVIMVSATRGSGVEALVETLDGHRKHLADRGGLVEVRRQHHAMAWVLRQLTDRFGSWGLEQLGGEAILRSEWPSNRSPFAHWRALEARLLKR